MQKYALSPRISIIRKNMQKYAHTCKIFKREIHMPWQNMQQYALPTLLMGPSRHASAQGRGLSLSHESLHAGHVCTSLVWVFREIRSGPALAAIGLGEALGKEEFRIPWSQSDSPAKYNCGSWPWRSSLRVVPDIRIHHDGTLRYCMRFHDINPKYTISHTI